VLRRSRVLVTGGPGFIGSDLVNRLVKEDCREVVVFEKVIPSNRFPSDHTLKFVRGEITQISGLKEIIRGVDYIFHIASLPLAACNQEHY
jgi:nucleoside-diphosphate-sugar epimerase